MLDFKSVFFFFFFKRPFKLHVSISSGSSNMATRSYHKMDLASLSGAVYGAADPLSMGLFRAGLPLSPDSTILWLPATAAFSPASRPLPTTPCPAARQQINTGLCRRGNHLQQMSPAVGGVV